MQSIQEISAHMLTSSCYREPMLPMLKTVLLILLLFGPAIPAAALESTAVRSPRATVSLVSETDTVAPGTPFRVGLHFQLAPGWHTYWKNPGDAGVAMELELTLPPGAQGGPIVWPTPQRLAEGSLITYAFTGDLLLPLTVTPRQDAGLTVIKAHAQWLVCKDICVPEEGDFRLDLSAGVAAPSAQAPLFAAHDRQVPTPSPWQAAVARDGKLWVQGPELTAATVVDAWFIPDTPSTIRDSAAQPLTLWQGGFTLALEPGKAFRSEGGLSGILTVRDRSGLETDVTLRATPGAVPPPPPSSMRLQRMLGLAFLGGLILNLMPCVFPVLAMKVVGLAGTERGRAHLHAAAYTAGVLMAFAVVGAALLAARAAGAAAGWGFQFQSPAFVAGMAWLLFGVGLNLSGVFQIGTGLVGAGQGLTRRSGELGSFFTGLLAVVVATPCTAPFMGVAIAAGLAAPPAVTMMVFLAMGLGMAMPYVLLAVVPGIGRTAPKPGRWMEILRQALAFPMYAASAWLVWVISQQAGPGGVLGTSAGLVLLGFAAWVLGITQSAADRGRRVGQIAGAAAFLAALAVLSGIATAPAPATSVAASGTEPFSAGRLATLREQGRPVFVNMTAAWCVTCLVNERVAIGTAAVRRAFADNHVTYLKGDWTRQDPEITRYLRENDRDGVPLYVYYPPNGRPNVLPQILTENTLLGVLKGDT
jgi:DsbC/DsbD-like thiol-disulfide interchange protein/cytochrome c biogenesis protein CcdA